MSDDRRVAEYGSDVVVDLMKAFGVEYAAFNPGSTFRGIHDSIVNYGGNGSPEVIECCHEEISVAIAHGYAKATGRPMVAITHNVVGLQHASMAIYNAWCDRVPVVVLGGTGPMDTSQRRPWADWVHTALVQGNSVRDFVKWDDQPHSIAAVPDSFIRAYRLAVTEPCAPVYLCFDTNLQENKLDEPVIIPDLARYTPPGPLPGNPDSIGRATKLLARAKKPVIISGRVGLQPGSLESFVDLAELLGAPVIDPCERFGFPNTHPLDLTGDEAAVLDGADVVLALEVRDLQGALGTIDLQARRYRYLPGPETKVIAVGVKDLLVRSWPGDHAGLTPIDEPIMADATLAVRQLIDGCKELGLDAEASRSRFAEIKARHDALRAESKRQAQDSAHDHPITTLKLVTDVWEAIKGEDWVLVNAPFGPAINWARRIWDWQQPYQYLGYASGGGLGYGIGAAIGGALAYRNTDKLCVNLMADGDFLMSSSALWTIAHHRLPMLIVMLNNRSYGNSEKHQAQAARSRGRDVANAGIGTRLDDPPVDFAKLAESFGLHGEGPIGRPEDVLPAIRRALKVVKEQRIAALVDVVTGVPAL